MEPLDFLVIEIESLKADNSPAAKPLIQKVSSILIDIETDFKKYFEPKLVALGPLHHDNLRFERAEQTKLRYAALFAMENETNGLSLFNKIKAEINDLRCCYDPDDIRKYNDDELSQMFVVDGSAVLFAIHYGGVERKFDKLNTKADRLVFAQIDLFMLENQLPYRVLQILIDSTKEPQKWKDSITKFIANSTVTNIQGAPLSDDPEDGKDNYVHLLERLRRKHLTGSNKFSRDNSAIGSMLLKYGDSGKHLKTFRSIKELKESGISVKPSNTNNLKNISFYCNFLGSLKMPRLLVDDSTASKFMNLVALEMCPDFQNDLAITSYLCYFGSLINTAEYVKELRVAGVLHSYVGSDQEVSELFKKMSRNLVPDQNTYAEVTNQIHKYCNNPLTPSLARLYYTHFSQPWTMVGFLGGIAYLIFSGITAFLSLRKALMKDDK